MLDPAGADLAGKLRAFEHLLDAAYAAAGELAVAAVRARKAHNLSATVGHSIFTSIDKASSAVMEARSNTVRGHRLLEQLGKSLNVTTAFGDEQKDQGDHKVFTGA